MGEEVRKINPALFASFRLFILKMCPPPFFKYSSPEHCFVWCPDLYSLESRLQTPGKLWDVVLEKGGEDQLDR